VAEPETITWHMSAPILGTAWVAALVWAVIGVLVAASNPLGAGTVFGVVSVALAVYGICKAYRITLSVSADDILIHNLFKASRIDLMKVTAVSASRAGVRIAYRRDGESCVTHSSAGQGLLDPELFPKLASHANAIVEALQVRLPDVNAD
jgi:hypothetical protein